METEATGSARQGGLFDSLRKLLATLLTIATTRLELLSTEIQEELHRVAAMLFFAMTAFVFGTLGVLMLGVFAIVYYWDTHRLLAAGLVTGLFLALAVAAALFARARIHAGPHLLGATINELRRDRDALGSHR